MKDLKFYPNTLKEFVSYCRDKKIDVVSLLSLPVNFQIGHYIDFIATKGIAVHADCDCYAISYSTLETKENKERVSELLRISNDIFIKSEVYNKSINIIDSYCKAILAAFKYLETPF